MGEQTDDGKIRIRCTGCGKRVKFPANQPGQAFRCPLCKTTMVAPLDGEDAALPSAQEIQSATRNKVHRFRPHTMEKDEEPLKPEPATEAPRTPIQRITSFLIKETERTSQLSEAILARTAMPFETKIAQIRQLRQAKAYHFKQFVEAILKEMDTAISALRDSPVADTDTGKERLQKLFYERRAVLLFLNLMYEFKPVSESAANGGTRDSAKAQPTTASTQDARTAPRSGDVRPAPGGKAQGNNASPTL